MEQIILAMGIPSAIFGFFIWLLKRYIDKKDAEREKHDKNVEALMLYQIKMNRATNILAEATAKAVQRIPDAHCNGDMHEALERAHKIQEEEKDFLLERGVDSIF